MITVCQCKIQYIVEESKPSRTPHLHGTRKGNKFSPYKSAASRTTNSETGYESFSLNCPHVADASSKDVKLEVTWTVNDTIWLKIENGNQRIYNKLTTFTKKTVNGKSVLRVLLNNGRYFFDYNELTGEFAMEIRPVAVAEDVGVWQCHVTVYQKDDTHTLTSRSRVKHPHVHRHNIEESKQLPIAAAQIGKRIITMNRMADGKERKQTPERARYFTRDDGGPVQISRDDTGYQSLVVFSRQNSFLRNRVIKHVPDYESIDFDEHEEEDHSRSRTRSTSIRSNSSLKPMPIYAFVTVWLIHALF